MVFIGWEWEKVLFKKGRYEGILKGHGTVLYGAMVVDIGFRTFVKPLEMYVKKECILLHAN